MARQDRLDKRGTWVADAWGRAVRLDSPLNWAGERGGGGKRRRARGTEEGSDPANLGEPDLIP